LEGENFNWSCRTHRSEYGGEMWWCCGKLSKDAPGCKFAKHETKDEEEEEQAEADNQKKIKRTKCLSCKEQGHIAADCYRDPNLRTGKEAFEEGTRIEKYKEFRRMNNDTFEFTSKLFERLARERGETAFGKGAMKFDDYSYKALNQVVFSLARGNTEKGRTESEDDDLDGMNALVIGN